MEHEEPSSLGFYAQYISFTVLMLGVARTYLFVLPWTQATIKGTNQKASQLPPPNNTTWLIPEELKTPMGIYNITLYVLFHAPDCRFWVAMIVEAYKRKSAPCYEILPATMLILPQQIFYYLIINEHDWAEHNTPLQVALFIYITLLKAPTAINFLTRGSGAHTPDTSPPLLIAPCAQLAFLFCCYAAFVMRHNIFFSQHNNFGYLLLIQNSFSAGIVFYCALTHLLKINLPSSLTCMTAGLLSLPNIALVVFISDTQSWTQLCMQLPAWLLCWCIIAYSLMLIPSELSLLRNKTLLEGDRVSFLNNIFKQKDSAIAPAPLTETHTGPTPGSK